MSYNYERGGRRGRYNKYRGGRGSYGNYRGHMPPGSRTRGYQMHMMPPNSMQMGFDQNKVLPPEMIEELHKKVQEKYPEADLEFVQNLLLSKLPISLPQNNSPFGMPPNMMPNQYGYDTK